MVRYFEIKVNDMIRAMVSRRVLGSRTAYSFSIKTMNV